MHLDRDLKTSIHGNSGMATVAATTPSIGLGRVPYIDGIRAILALAVVWDHLVDQIWPIYVRHIKVTGMPLAFLWTVQHPNLPALFFLLSGFVLTIPVINNGGALKGGISKFYYTRLVRLFVPYYAAIIFSLILIATLIGQRTGTHWDKSLPVTHVGVVAHILMMHDVYGSDQINHALWTMALETKMCLVFPILIILRARIGGGRLVAASVLLCLPLMRALSGTNFQSLRVEYYPVFCLGILAAEIAFETGTQAFRWQALRAKIGPNWLAAVLSLYLLSTMSAHPWISDYVESVFLGACICFPGMSEFG